MKLDGVKLLEENAREFRVSHPEHGEMRISKEHLHYGTVAKIKQHFAEGGEVKAEKTGPLEALKRLVTHTPGGSSSPSVFDAAATVKAHNEKLEQAANAEKMADGGEVLPENPWFIDAGGGDTVGAGIKDTLSSIFPIGSPGTAQVRPTPPASTTAAPPSSEAAPAVQQPAPIAQAPAAPTAAPLPGVSGEFNSGLKQELAGIQGQGAAAQEQARQESAALQQRQVGLQKMQTDFEGQMSAHSARVEKLQTDILNGKIDANRFWNTRSTGQKITAALGMILGGAGAGVTGQPNYAIQAIDKAIDRDLESQKLELGKKETLLGYYMQQGHQLMSAHQLAKADYMDITGAQMMKAAAEGGGAKAAAVAQQLAGAAKMGADQMRRQATLQGLQIQQTKMSTDFQRAQLGAMQQLMGGASSGGSNLDPRAEMLLPEEMRGRIVRLGDGTAALARTPKDAEEVKKSQEGSAVIRDKLRRYSEILARHPHGASEILSNEDYNSAKSIHDSLITDLNGLAGLNRLNEREVELFSSRIPDITSKQILKGHQAKLKELGAEIDSKVWNMNRTYLSLPQKRRPSG